jgi:hypothetical protein
VDTDAVGMHSSILNDENLMEVFIRTSVIYHGSRNHSGL